MTQNNGITDGAYLEMANHAKQLIEDKEKIIKYLKEKFDDLDSDARKIEYRVKQMEHLIRFKIFENTSKERKMLEFLLIDLQDIHNVSDTIRHRCQSDEDEEDIILMLNLTDSTDSV